MNKPNHNTPVTETPDVSYIKNVDVTHETSDVYIADIAKFVVGLSVLTIAVFFLTWGLFRAFESRVAEPPRSPMALSDKERLPAEPRLQGAPGFGEQLGKTADARQQKLPAETEGQKPKGPRWEIEELQKQWQDVLDHGPIDQNGKRYGMPIEKAKEEILKQGLPVRKQ
jgi:hypothetical protein